jgi:hypothetical protein
LRQAASALVWFVVALATALSAACAADEDARPLENFFPPVTRRPVLEREVGVHVTASKGHEGREVDVVPFVAIPVLPRWQIELDVPTVFKNPRAGAAVAGVGDIELENKFVLSQSRSADTMLSGGVSLTLPTGSGRRDLGGETAVEPFVSAGLVRQGLYLVGGLGYEWTLAAPSPGAPAQTLTSGVAVGYQVRGWLIPLFDVSTVTKVRGRDAPGAEDRRGRTQVYVTPGVNIQLRSAATLSVGVQLPVSTARSFDYALHSVLDWSF